MKRKQQMNLAVCCSIKIKSLSTSWWQKRRKVESITGGVSRAWKLILFQGLLPVHWRLWAMQSCSLQRLYAFSSESQRSFNFAAGNQLIKDELRDKLEHLRYLASCKTFFEEVTKRDGNVFLHGVSPDTYQRVTAMICRFTKEFQTY